MKVEQTTNYSMFKFREDNRIEINKSHVQRLSKSIQLRNMLEYRPIDINAKMEIIDGQHRLKAAEQLGVPIYFRIIEDHVAGDVIVLNVAKTWLTGDYMHYYCKNHYPEYLKLQDFMKRTGLTLKVALAIVIGYTKEAYVKFKEGAMKFQDDEIDLELEICLSTVEFLKKMGGRTNYTSAIKFWRPLIKLVQSANFNLEKWERNMKKLYNRIGPRATEKDYQELFQSIHNYHNLNKIDITSDRETNESE